ncbi:hypothetical protein P170DRAFT_437796 [Aspergillus steynii IBT 23096]|uniref:Uncharacterized protein n=1 Tax=Aspergillus steynii IBT 23096 TaxID=1392250 RepID=A0A2I2G5E3_9EURO|nr:uncharacterized protein P170DRAFT_437796 [Aspergillus steynii IBT 23096]PLB48084.1 hypothetical protein P170DRAFT_437796 [Aspergillus steynii IBT 23096]
MSAPNQGRQSPDPERQTGAQQQEPPSSGNITSQLKGSSEQSRQEAQQGGLTSNPKHILEDVEAKKFTKGPGN